MHFKNLEIEVNLYNKIFKKLKWYTVDINGEKILSFDGIYPVIINKKKIIKLSLEKQDYPDSSLTFRPYKNSRQCQVLIDNMLNEGEVEKYVKTHKAWEDGNIFSYSAFLIQKETDEIMLETHGCKTETEAKFRLFMNYYFGNEYDDDIDLMIEEEEKFKEFAAANSTTKGKKKKK